MPSKPEQLNMEFRQSKPEQLNMEPRQSKPKQLSMEFRQNKPKQQNAESRRSRRGLIIVLAIVIVALLAVGAIAAIKYTKGLQGANVGGVEDEKKSGLDTTTFAGKYIDGFRRIGARSGPEPYQYGSHIDTIATQMGLDYEDRTMPLMHVIKFGDEYIYDEYVKVYLYLYAKQSDTNDEISVEDLLNEYENGSDELMQNKVLVWHQKGGDTQVYHYLIEISRAYELYAQQNGANIQGKELRDLVLDDYIELEEWALANSNSEEFPTIFRVNEQ